MLLCLWCLLSNLSFCNGLLRLTLLGTIYSMTFYQKKKIVFDFCCVLLLSWKSSFLFACFGCCSFKDVDIAVVSCLKFVEL